MKKYYIWVVLVASMIGGCKDFSYIDRSELSAKEKYYFKDAYSKTNSACDSKFYEVSKHVLRSELRSLCDAKGELYLLDSYSQECSERNGFNFSTISGTLEEAEGKTLAEYCGEELPDIQSDGVPLSYNLKYDTTQTENLGTILKPEQVNNLIEAVRDCPRAKLAVMQQTSQGKPLTADLYNSVTETIALCQAMQLEEALKN